MKAINDIGAWIKRVYDKLLLLVVVAALIASAVFLVLRIGSIQRMDEAYDAKLNDLTPRYPMAEEAVSDSFDLAMSRLSQPPQIPGWTNRLSSPKKRVWCIHCRQPVAYSAEVCPFCDGVQPDIDIITELDDDQDGIPNGIEEENGLNPDDPSDAALDADGDLFSNLDEYTHKTDMQDPEDYPSIETFLGVQAIDAIPFDLLFKSYMRGTGDNRTFAINTRNGGRTYFVKLGETVEGFEVVKFELKFEADPSIPGMKKDVSILTLRKGGHEVPLIKGDKVRYEDFTLKLVFRLENRPITAKIGDQFQLRKGRVYKVMEVDTARKNVVISRLSDGEMFTVGSLADGDNR